MTRHSDGQDQNPLNNRSAAQVAQMAQDETSRQISDTAIDWLVKLSSGQVTPDMQRQYQHWLAQSPRHEQAVTDARTLLDGIGRTATAKQWQEAGDAASANAVNAPDFAGGAGADDLMGASDRLSESSLASSPNANIAGASARGNHKDAATRAPGHDGKGGYAMPRNATAAASYRRAAIGARAGVRTGSGGRLVMWMAVLLVLVCGAGAAIVPGMVGPVAGLFADYATGIGEQKTITLADGTVVHLNTASALSVHYTPTRREVHLQAGEAWFDVHKNPNRPFVVMAGNGQARAVGTSYDVALVDDAVHVRVSEGIVAVSAANGEAAASTADLPDASSLENGGVRVLAGQQVAYDASGRLGAVRTFDDAGQSAWRRGKLIFNQQPLNAVIADIQRYRKGRIVLINQGLASLKVSGVFDLHDLDDLLKSIDETTPASVISTPVMTLIY
ncbi:FecR domain-containing protein [Thalassospira profundimaris]|uniref:FecR family protein n=1 Tax=Thalassospira profundimaris TaxID=502049 RepID=UPI0011BEA0A7|nr:FecR domain-containing protein [Thalassospira profundimaris]